MIVQILFVTVQLSFISYCSVSVAVICFCNAEFLSVFRAPSWGGCGKKSEVVRKGFHLCETATEAFKKVSQLIDRQKPFSDLSY